jgi:hypothetical protein
MKTYCESDFTEWFPPSMVPGQAGVYQTKQTEPNSINAHNVGFQAWNPVGKYYGMRQISPNYAEENAIHQSAWQNVWFRGLKEQPK